MCVRLYVIFALSSRTPRARRSGVPFASLLHGRCAALTDCFLGAFAPPRSFATSLFIIISLRTEESRKRLRSRMTRRRDSRSGLRYCNMRGILPLVSKVYHIPETLSRLFSGVEGNFGRVHSAPKKSVQIPKSKSVHPRAPVKAAQPSPIPYSGKNPKRHKKIFSILLTIPAHLSIIVVTKSP